MFWELPGVYTTAVGYAAGFTPNPTYREVCTGLTGHNEVVRVVFDPAVVTYEALLKAFWESHDPTQGMQQGPDVGTQYRSGIYSTRKRSAGPPRLRVTRTRGFSEKPATATSRRRSSTRPSSTTPRIITSSTSRRTPAVTAGSKGPA